MSDRPAAIRRSWALALASSVALHAFALFGVPEVWVAQALPSPSTSLIARIVEAPEATPLAKRETPMAPKPKPAARPKPKPVPPAPVSLPDPNPPAAAGPTPPPLTPAADPTEEAQQIETATTTEDLVPPVAVVDPTPIEKQVPARGPVVQRSKYPLKSATLIYDLNYGANPMRVGRVTHTWSNDGERYFAETVIEATGVFALLYGGQYVQRSWGVFGPNGLIPSEFFVQRGRADRAETAQFDWESERVDFAWRSERRSAKLTAGTQDPISMLHQIFFMQPLPEAKALNVATSRKLATFEYAFLGEENIDTPLGNFRALHVRRKDDDADHIDVWVDPVRSFLPVRIHYIDRKGVVFDQRVREIHFEPVAVEATEEKSNVEAFNGSVPGSR